MACMLYVRLHTCKLQVSFPRVSTPTMVRCGSEDSFIFRRDDRVRVGQWQLMHDVLNDP